MFRLSATMLDLFLLLLMVVCVMVSKDKVEDEAPPDMAHFIVESVWEDVTQDVDLWGKRIGGTECGYSSREVENLTLHGDWVGNRAGLESPPSIVHEILTIDQIRSGTYGFSIHGFRLESPVVSVKVRVTAVSPYRVLYENEYEITNRQWKFICRLKIDDDGKVVELTDDLPVKFWEKKSS